MFDAHTYALFLATAAVLVLSPGPDTVFVLSRTLASGPSAGLATLIGTQVGNVVHAVLAGVGVTTVVLVFPALFTALKVVGIAYLLWLAVGAWRASATLALAAGRRGPAGMARCFAQGLANNLANPKMIAFFVALFPQFVRPEACGLSRMAWVAPCHPAAFSWGIEQACVGGPTNACLALQSLALGATLAAMAVLWIGAWVLAVGRFRGAVAENPTFLGIANRLAAVIFVGLACRLAVQDGR